MLKESIAEASCELVRSARECVVQELVPVGGHETVFDGGRWIARAEKCIPGFVQVEIISNAGHHLTYNQPDEVNRRLLRFFDEVEGRPALPA